MPHKSIVPVLFTFAVLALSTAPTAAAQTPMPDFALPSWSDVSWRDPSNYSTIQTGDIDGDGDDELFGRSDTQVEVHHFDPQIGNWIPLPSVDRQGTFGNGGGWNQAAYYSTIHAANLDGQGGDEIYGRSSSGIAAYSYDPSGRTWSTLPLLTGGDAPSDGNGWEFPQYYLTLQAADVDGDGQDELFGRGHDGIHVWKLVSGQWQELAGMSFANDTNGWDAPQYYRTIHAADFDGDGTDEIFLRGGDGIHVCSFDAGAGDWSCGPAENDFSDTDPNGWTDSSHYLSIQAANLDGQPGDEVFGRGSDGIHAAKWDKNANQWDVLPAFTGPDAPTDSGGWNEPPYGLTFMHGDIDGDGRDEIIARGAAGLSVWAFNGSGWEGRPYAPDFCDDCGWGSDRYYLTLQTTRTGLNNADQVIGRGLTGVVTYSFDTQENEWGPASAQFPAYTTGDELNAYQAINQAIGGAFNPDFDIRQAYSSTPNGTLSGWATLVRDIPQPSTVSSTVWDEVQGEIVSELTNAAAVGQWYENYLTRFTNQLYVAEDMDATAQVLGYATNQQAELEMEEMEMVEGVLEGVNALDVLPDGVGEAAVVVNSLLGGGFTAGLGVDGVNGADEVDGTYLQLRQKLQTDFSAAVAGNADAQQAIQSDFGLLSAVGGLITSHTWVPLSGTNYSLALANAEEAYSLGIWQTILPAIWVAYEFSPGAADGWCLYDNSCDWQGSNGDYWELEWNYSFGSSCDAFNPSLGPCQPAPRGLRQQLFGQTSSACQTAWSSSCNLGQSPAAVLLGAGAWQDLPAYFCKLSGWAETLSCESLRGSDPGGPRRAGRMNLGGSKLSVSGVGWFACPSENRCQGVARGGAPIQPPAQATIKGAKRPAGQAIYRTGWSGRPGRRGTEAFSLEVPAAGGAYRLRLHFAETRRTKVGRHLFDLNVEGGPKELAGFDIMAAAGGRNRAIVREFPVTVGDGGVTIRFLRRKGAPAVSGMELIPTARAGAAPVQSRLRLGAVRERKGAVHISGRLVVRGTPRRHLVAIEARARGRRTFGTVTTLRTRPNGMFSARLKLAPRTTAIRARFAGDVSALPAVSRARAR